MRPGRPAEKRVGGARSRRHARRAWRTATGDASTLAAPGWEGSATNSALLATSPSPYRQPGGEPDASRACHGAAPKRGEREPRRRATSTSGIRARGVRDGRRQRRRACLQAAAARRWRAVLLRCRAGSAAHGRRPRRAARAGRSHRRRPPGRARAAPGRRQRGTGPSRRGPTTKPVTQTRAPTSARAASSGRRSESFGAPEMACCCSRKPTSSATTERGRAARASVERHVAAPRR